MPNLIIITIAFFIAAVFFLGLWISYRRKTRNSKKALKGLPILAASIIWGLCGIYILRAYLIAHTTDITVVRLEYLIDFPFLALVSFIALLSFLLVKPQN